MKLYSANSPLSPAILRSRARFLTSCSVSTSQSQEDLSVSPIPEPYLKLDEFGSTVNDPRSALNYFKWAEKQRGFVRGVDALCILLHILTKSRRIQAAHFLLNRHVSGNSSPSASVLIDRLLDTSQKCSSDSRVFNYVVHSFIEAGRIEDAAECFDRLIESGNIPGIRTRNALLTALVKANMMQKARVLFEEMVVRGFDCDCFTLDMIMHACFKEEKPEDAVKYFREMRSNGMEMDATAYNTVIRAVCKKPDSRAACEFWKK
ncbi:hypothetical protein Scep_027442 [Stephania cephalantha]|uniref:Pentatricopeptide repeat-containing protein n=1 Tax=Stephania cephalantha TaxID=152367 RepID=A0AAP0E7Y3_9MAGN